MQFNQLLTDYANYADMSEELETYIFHIYASKPVFMHHQDIVKALIRRCVPDAPHVDNRVNNIFDRLKRDLYDDDVSDLDDKLRLYEHECYGPRGVDPDRRNSIVNVLDMMMPKIDKFVERVANLREACVNEQGRYVLK